MANEVKVHRIIEGPFESDDEDEVWMLCLAEEDGELTEIEVYFDTFDEAYAFKHHFTKSIEPIILANDTGDH
jgi:hypothetical protein